MRRPTDVRALFVRALFVRALFVRVLFVRALFVMVAVIGCSSAASNNGTSNGAPANARRVPLQHRSAAEACTQPPPTSDCSTCSNCVDGAVCMAGKHICTCRKDACASDSECTSGGVCACRTTARDARGFNICLVGNCRVDADCGLDGYCSPTWDLACGESDGVVGYYCHTPRDQCMDDGDCVDGGKSGYCAWSTDRWKCAYAVCL